MTQMPMPRSADSNAFRRGCGGTPSSAISSNGCALITIRFRRTLQKSASEAQGRQAKIAVWEHNSHLGDARATYMRHIGEHNVGQLVRERYGRDAVLLGFTTYSGTVTAASNWGATPEHKRVRPALQGSFEALFHETKIPNFLIAMRDDERASSALRRERLERAIGVIYLPQTERASHYFEAQISK